MCHIEHDGPLFENACLAEAKWVADQCSQSKLPYQIVATGPLESPNGCHYLLNFKKFRMFVGFVKS